MFRLINIPVFSFLLLIAPLLLKGQETWSLQKCVEHALKNNISVKQSEISLEQAKISLQQKKLQMAPSLNGSASNNYNYGRSVDPYTYTFTTEQIQSANFSLNGNLTLFNGFQLQNELKLEGKVFVKRSSNAMPTSLPRGIITTVLIQQVLALGVTPTA